MGVQNRHRNRDAEISSVQSGQRTTPRITERPLGASAAHGAFRHRHPHPVRTQPGQMPQLPRHRIQHRHRHRARPGPQQRGHRLGLPRPAESIGQYPQNPPASRFQDLTGGLDRTVRPTGPQTEVRRSIRIGVDKPEVDVPERTVPLEEGDKLGDGVQPRSHRHAVVNDKHDLEAAFPCRPVDR